MFYRNRSRNAVQLILVGLVVLTLGAVSARAQGNPSPAGRYTGSNVLLQGQVTDTAGVPQPGEAGSRRLTEGVTIRVI